MRHIIVFIGLFFLIIFIKLLSKDQNFEIDY